jgi:hypothetical protein
MPVAFDPLIVEPFDRRAYNQEVADALYEPTTRIFLDTNILMWTYGLHGGARADLCDWLKDGPQKGRIHIPRRVIHEFSAHRNDQNALYPFGQQFKGLTKALEAFEQKAPLVADDTWASQKGFTDRATYLGEVSIAREAISKLIEPIIKGDKLETLHSQLIPVFNALALEGDIHSDLSQLRGAYEARAELRIAPGFKDINKGKKNEEDNVAAGLPAKNGANRFGDLAIWDEILTFVNAIEPKPKAVILLTHDGKPDWTYYPSKIIDLDGRAKPNKSEDPDYLGVAQPILVHELKTRTQIPALYILSIRQLAMIANLNPIAGFKFNELARAVQAEVSEEQSEEQSEGEPEVQEQVVEDDEPAQEQGAAIEGASPEDPQEGEQPNELQAFFANLPKTARADFDYTGDEDGLEQFEAVIKGLKSCNWYQQNPAVKQGLSLLAQSGVSLLQAFIFGRNLYQAAVGTSSDAMRALEGLESRAEAWPDAVANAVYAGAYFELYFGPQGNLREVPKTGQIDLLFQHQQSLRLAPAVNFICTELKNVHACLLVVPSPQPTAREFAIEFDEENAIVSVWLDRKFVTQPYGTNGADMRLLPPKVGYLRLRNMISQEFAIPSAQVQLAPEFEDARKVNDLEFIPWNPADGPQL